MNTLSWTKYLAAGAITVLLYGGASWAEDNPIFKANVYPEKWGTQAEVMPIEKFCGTKPAKVAFSSSVIAGDGWRKLALAEFLDEATKCKNITEATFTDAHGNPQTQITDIQSLVARGFNVIVVTADQAETVLRAMHDATAKGVAVVPWQQGLDFPGKAGVDWVANPTPSQADFGEMFMTWIAKTLNGKGNVLVYGGAPGAVQTVGQIKGYTPVLSKYPDLKLLNSEPIITNWIASDYQKLTPALLAKYPQIDAAYADWTFGVMGALRAFKAENRPIPLVTGLATNEFSCFWQKEHASEPHFQAATINAWNWLIRVALHKGLAAYEGIDDPEPTYYKSVFAEDTTDPNKQPVCDPNLPPDVSRFSTQLSTEQILKLFPK
jgi:ribose transport system substrate-binding protein